MLYLLAALGMGLLISSLTRSQFLAGQITILVSFLPAVLLSGFLFDLRNVPPAVRVIGHLLPSTYYMELLKTLLLAGDNLPLAARNCGVLALDAVLFFLGALRATARGWDSMFSPLQLSAGRFTCGNALLPLSPVPCRGRS